MSTSIVQPKINYDQRLTKTPNIFRDRWAKASDDEWRRILVRSATERVIDGIEFPSFPDQELQQAMHGSSTMQNAIVESFIFYQFIKKHCGDSFADQGGMFLDFGCGWGRMTRPFMRDFALANIYGFEPNYLFAVIARSLNPYVCILTGGFTPDRSLPADRFDLIVGWSVFSHLSEMSATQWITELCRCLKPGGLCFFTTWGVRFLQQLLIDEQSLKAGKSIHFYSELQIKKAGDIQSCIDRYTRGDFVFFGGQNDLYGTAFLSEVVLRRLIERNNLPLTIELFDSNSLSQDVFAVRRW